MPEVYVHAIEGRSKDQKRALIKAFITVVIMPSGKGRAKFDPDLIEINEL